MTLLLASSSSTLHRLHRFLLLASSDPARSSPVSCFSPGFSYAVVASVNSSLVSPDASSSTCLFNYSSSQHIYIIIINNHHQSSITIIIILITSVLSVGGRWPWWAARQICHWTRPPGQPLHGRVQGHPHSTCTTAQGDGVPTCLAPGWLGGIQFQAWRPAGGAPRRSCSLLQHMGTTGADKCHSLPTCKPNMDSSISNHEPNQQRSRGSDRVCTTGQSLLPGSTHLRRKRRGRRGKRRGRKRKREGRKRQLKSERLAKSHLRILYWNCDSLSVRRSTAELLCGGADIVCLQETQGGHMKPMDFHPIIKNDEGHGQAIAMRKLIRYKELDVSRWSTKNLHLVAVELMDQPVRNVVNVYACCGTMKEQDWRVLDNLQSTLPGETILCGDFNARGALWGKRDHQSTRRSP